jgi:hypothetical protein
MLLAIGCGLLILVAGAVMFVVLANQDEPRQAIAVGTPVRVGDMEITVDGVSERAGAVLVDIEIGGVEDPDGSEAFRLVVPGEALAADATAGNHCGATTVLVQPCTLAFRVGDDAGSSRVLLYQRGDERVRWELATG